MRRKLRYLLSTVALLGAGVCLAQQEGPSPLDIPSAAEQHRAAQGMLLVMLSALIVVVLLLRWVGKRQRNTRSADKDEQSPFEKAKRHFEDEERRP